MPLLSMLPTNGDLTATFDAESDELKQLLVHVRRHLHAHPELSFEEFETSRFIREILEAYNFDVSDPIAETGLYVDIEGEHPGPTIGYRADIDALPIDDTKDASYASSRPGVAHLCGHDAHTAIAIGVALLLRRHRDRINGRVRVFFQPAEETTPSGAPEMIAGGILDDLQAVYAVHADPSRPVGTFGLRTGAVTASSDRFTVHIYGKSTGHSARPHEVDDTIWIATQIANTLYQQVGRIQDTRRPAVLTIGKFEGGNALNVIPDQVEFGGTLRTVSPEDRALLSERIERIVENFSDMYNVRAEANVTYGSPSVQNDEELISIVAGAIDQHLGPEAIQWIPRPSMGGEDFAHYLTHIPGALVRLGTSDGPDTSRPLHDSRFDLSEDALPLGVHIMTQTLINTLDSYAKQSQVASS